MKLCALRRFIGALGLVLTAVQAGVSRPAVAQGPEQLPAPTGYVNDFAAVLGQGSRTALEDLARRVNVATKGDMVIVTLRDIGDRAPAEMALTIGRQWKVGANAEIGDRARNAGTIILVVPKETASTGRGSCFIGTGQGTEGFITDATAGSICREATAFFRTQDYDTGIRLLAQRVAERYAQEFNVSLDGVSVPPPQQRARESQRQRNGSGIIGLIVVVFILMSLGGRGRGGGLLSWLPFLIASSSHGGRRHDGWGGGGFGGGGGGFGGFGGGGGFSGGGGGSDW